MARMLVTGATGFVGGRVVRRLRADGLEVVAVVRTPSEELQQRGVAQEMIGLDDADALGRLLGPGDAVVHLAATVGPDTDTARRVNRDGTAAVVAACRQAGVRRLVHMSTTAVYDLPQAGELVHEEAPLVADGPPYPVTKAEAEAVVADAIANGLPATVLRPPAVLGAGPTSTWGTRVPERVRAGAAPARHEASTFAWVHVEDLADAVAAAADGDADVTANVVGAHATWGAYLDAVRALLPDRAPAIPEPDRADAPWTGRYATDRLPANLGVEPRRTFDAAMREIADWWRERVA